MAFESPPSDEGPEAGYGKAGEAVSPLHLRLVERLSIGPASRCVAYSGHGGAGGFRVWNPGTASSTQPADGEAVATDKTAETSEEGGVGSHFSDAYGNGWTVGDHAKGFSAAP